MTSTFTPSPTVWPALRAHDPHALIDFLVSVCGFRATAVHTGGAGQVTHAELAGPSGGGVMIGQAPSPACPEYETDDWALKPGSSGAYVVVDDAATVDAIFRRASDAGSTILRAPDEASRDVALRDPEGNRWRFGTYRGTPPT